jgi:hypothetical protein
VISDLLRLRRHRHRCGAGAASCRSLPGGAAPGDAALAVSTASSPYPRVVLTTM